MTLSLDGSRTALSRVDRLPAFRHIIYSNCWEDTETEIDALQLQPGARIVSVTASGGRSLNLLAAAPAEVISVDLNPAQNALLAFKRASLRESRSYADHVRLLGAAPASSEVRLSLAERILPALPPESQRYWQSRRSAIARGVLACGRQDRMIESLGALIRSVKNEQALASLFTAGTLGEQHETWQRIVGGRSLRALARAAFSKPMLWMLYGSDLYADTTTFAMGEMMLRNLEEHVKIRPLRENYFLSRVLLGRSLDPERFAPLYLQRDQFERMRDRAMVVRFETQRLEDLLRSLPDASIDAFSYSDIFDWVAEPDFQALMRETTRVARPGARVCYRVCLMDRYPAPDLRQQLVADEEAMKRLFVRDRSCFYRGLFIATVRGVGAS